MKRMTAFLCCVCLLAFAGCDFGQKIKRGVGKAVPGGARAGALGSREGERVYFVVEERGMRRSRGYQVRQRSRFRGHDCVVVQRILKQELMRDNATFVKTTRSKVITATSGAALYAAENSVNGTERREETLTIGQGEAVFETTGPGGTRKAKLAIPRGTMFGIEPTWLVKRQLKPEATFRRQVLDRKQRKLVWETVTIEARRMENVLGEEQEVWITQVSQEGYSPQKLVFTLDGEFVRIEDEDLVVRTVTKDEYESRPPAAKVVSTVQTDFSLPAWDNFSALIYELEPGNRWRKYIKRSRYVSINEEGGRLMVSLKRSAIPDLGKLTLPMNVPGEIQPFLAPADSIMPDRHAIRQQARYIIRKQKNVLRCVQLLAGWVHLKVKFRPSGSLNPSPLKTLETSSGDCSEHADLFASLARSVGIPTRHCQGLLVQKDNAVYHTWVEAWLGGVWAPVDSTVNRVGLPAGYLLTSRGNGQGVPRDGFAWNMRRGGLSLSLKKAGKEHLKKVGQKLTKSMHVLIPGNVRSYIAVDDTSLLNLYWGFSLERPRDWHGRVSRDMVVSLTSPDNEARIVCEGLGQVYHATETGLDRVLTSLEHGLTRYRQIDAGVVRFGKVRPSKALFVDFTCEQGGQSLRCQQYIIPKRGRSYRIAVWAPTGKHKRFAASFKAILDSIRL